MKKTTMILIIGICLVLAGVVYGAFNVVTTYSDGLASVNMTFTGDENITRFVDIPLNAFVSNATMTIEGRAAP